MSYAADRVVRKERNEEQNNNDIQPVLDLMARVLGPDEDRFIFHLVSHCDFEEEEEKGQLRSTEETCFQLRDGDVNGTVDIFGTGVNELSAGLGMYLRRVANVTIGWPRGGGSSGALPPVSEPLPPIGKGLAYLKKRAVPWSYFMNVCTHSYSFVWYGWKEWEALIDWMALWGINNVLALTVRDGMISLSV